jgi:WD40 repeat protein
MSAPIAPFVKLNYNPWTLPTLTAISLAWLKCVHSNAYGAGPRPALLQTQRSQPGWWLATLLVLCLYCHAQTPSAPPHFRLQLQTLDDSLGEAKIALAPNGITAVTWRTSGSDAKVWDLRSNRQIKLLDTSGCGEGYLKDVQVSSDSLHITGLKTDQYKSATKCTWNLLTSAVEKQEALTIPAPGVETTMTAPSGNRVTLRKVGPIGREITRLLVTGPDSAAALQQLDANGCTLTPEAALCSALDHADQTMVVSYARRGVADKWVISQHSNGAHFSPDGAFLFLVEEHLSHTIDSRNELYRENQRNRWNEGLTLDVEESVTSIYDVKARTKIDQLAPQPWYLTFSASPAGDVIAIFGNNELRLWSTRERKLLRTITGHRLDANGLPSLAELNLSDAAFSANGATLYTGDWDGSFLMWDVASGKQLGSLRASVNPVEQVTLSPDGKYLAIQAGFVSVWSLDSWREVLRLPADTKSKVAFSPSRPILAVGNPPENRVYLWNLEQAVLVGGFKVEGITAGQVEFSGDGRFLYILSEEGRIAVGDVRSDDLTATLRTSYRAPTDDEYTNAFKAATQFGNNQFFYTFSRSAKGDRAVVGCSGFINVVDPRDGHSLFQIPVNKAQKSWANPPTISQDGKFALILDEEKPRTGPAIEVVELWDLDDRKAVQRFRMPRVPLGNTTFSETGDVVTLAADRVIIWDRALGTPKRVITGRFGHFAFQNVMDSRRKLIYAPYESGVQVARLETGESLATITPLAGGRQKTFELLAQAGDAAAELAKNLDDTVPVEQLFTPIRSSRWVVSTGDGRFDTNELDEIRGIHWVADDDPLRALPLEIFMREYFTPGLLARVLKGEHLERLPDLTQRNRLQPSVEITSVTPSSTSPRTVEVTVNVKNVHEGQRTSGVRDLKLFRDGQLVGVSALDPKLEEQRVKISGVRLPAAAENDEIEFSAYAFNSDLIKSQTHRFVFPLPKATARLGTAYILTVGVNQTPNSPNLALRYAANDATSLADALALRLGQTGEWERVVSKVLISSAANPGGASKAAIRAAFEALQHSVQPEDLVILAFSGHGFTDSSGMFYVVPADVRTRAGTFQPETAVSTTELSEWIRAIDAREMVLLVDACQSAASVNSQGFKPGPMGSAGLGQLAYDKRMLVLAASQSDGVALENSKLQHGLLTYSLLADGIENRQADWRPKDGQVTLSEWLAFGEHRVPALAEDVASGKVRGLNQRGVVLPAGKDRLIQLPTLFDFRRDNGADPLLIKKAP